jgi:glucosamine--fructose-6-phosphate aminotransferase (isomerizing)
MKARRASGGATPPGWCGDLVGHLTEIAEARDVLYLGRGSAFPLALKGGLKLKEVSCLHAEGYAAGEMKHGPIPLIDGTVPAVALAPMTTSSRSP